MIDLARSPAARRIRLAVGLIVLLLCLTLAGFALRGVF